MTLVLDGRPEEWIEGLPSFQRDQIIDLLKAEDFEAVSIRLLQRTGSSVTVPFGTASQPENYYAAIKAEMRLFTCGDPKYADLREQCADLWSSGKSSVLLCIAGVIGSVIGVAAAVILPVVALLLAMATKMGTEAWCAMQSEG